LKSGTQKPAPVTAIVHMCGNAFAVTRRDGQLDIRRIPARKKPARAARQQVLPFPERER